MSAPSTPQTDLPERPHTPDEATAVEPLQASAPDTQKRSHPGASSPTSASNQSPDHKRGSFEKAWYKPSYVENPWAQLEQKMGLEPAFVPGSDLGGVKEQRRWQPRPQRGRGRGRGRGRY